MTGPGLMKAMVKMMLADSFFGTPPDGSFGQLRAHGTLLGTSSMAADEACLSVALHWTRSPRPPSPVTWQMALEPGKP